MGGLVLPNLEVMRVAALPAASAAYVGQYRRTTSGLFWCDGAQWLQLDGTSSVDPWEFIVLPSNVAVSTTTFADVTGLSFYAAANTLYEVEVFGAIQTVATATGAALALDIPSGNVIGQGIHNLAAATLTGWEQIADGATTGAGSGMRATGTNVPISFKALASVGSTPGTVQLRLRSEIASSAVTLQAGLVLMKYRKARNQSVAGRIVPITQSAYDALSPKDPNTLYAIVSAPVTAPSHKWLGVTAAQYAAIGTKDPETLYVVKD